MAVRCAVLGSGAWGTALAIALARGGRTVALAARRPGFAAQLQRTRENTDYLPGHRLPDAVEVVEEPALALAGARVVLFASPVAGFADWAARAAAAGGGDPGAWWVSLAKGLELTTLRRPVEILAAASGGRPCATLSGPSHAAEVAEGLPAALVLASAHAGDPSAREVQHTLGVHGLRVYLSDDVVGVECAGSLKNVYAIAAGCADGLGLGDNARAALLTRALAEMVRIGTALGAKAPTFYGLGGVGDLLATATGAWSRNRQLGLALASGRSAAEVLGERRSVTEGYNAAAAFRRLCLERSIDAPILEQIHAILHAARPPAEALRALLARELKRE
jgi:glycerol-3-phosphate dehydrogenase (NAD(P)+)